MAPKSLEEEWRPHVVSPPSTIVLDVESGAKGREKDASRSRLSTATTRSTEKAPSVGSMNARRFPTKSNGRTNERQAIPKNPLLCTHDASYSADFLKVCKTILLTLGELWNRPGAALKDQGGSYSPEAYAFIQSFQKKTTSTFVKLSLAILGLLGTPLVFYNCLPASSPSGVLQAVATFWDGCLLLSSTMVFVTCLLVSFYYAATEQQWSYTKRPGTGTLLPSKSFRSNALHVAFHSNSKVIRFHRMAFLVMLFFVALIGIIGPWTLIFPSWIWHPFLWGRYQVYWPSKLAPAMQGLCVDYSLDEGKNGRLPLCLTRENWDTLSSGALSSRSSADVEAVLEGIAYGKQQSGGIVISILARDVVDFIASLRQNVESLVPFFSNVSVVVFENDSMDGSREAFKRWKSVVKGYNVDLLECADAVDCKFGNTHRDDVLDFSHSSAVGDMHKYRQRVVDYVLGNPVYKDYSHMIVLDIDLGVSLSPLGVLHTLGSLPDNPVASVGRQPWPTAFGSLITPYDFSAFRPYVTKKNARLVEVHKAFCNLMPEGDRWRNECDAFSPIQMIEVLSHDRVKAAFVRVESAFNGAVMYPLKLIRSSHAEYNAGADGQRCEHVGFHQNLKKPMYMNRKWDMHLSPTIPGGPNGSRAQRTATRIFFSPFLSGILQLIHFGATAIFVWSSMSLGAFFFFPFLFQGGLQLPWHVLGQTRRKKRASHAHAI